MNHLVGQALSQAACGQWYSHPWVQPRAAQAGWVQTHAGWVQAQAGRLRTRPSIERGAHAGQHRAFTDVNPANPGTGGSVCSRLVCRVDYKGQTTCSPYWYMC